MYETIRSALTTLIAFGKNCTAKEYFCYISPIYAHTVTFTLELHDEKFVTHQGIVLGVYYIRKVKSSKVIKNFIKSHKYCMEMDNVVLTEL